MTEYNNMTQYASFGQKMNVFLAINNLTNAAFCKMHGFNIAALAKWKKGMHPSFKNIQKLIKTTNGFFSLNDFFPKLSENNN